MVKTEKTPFEEFLKWKKASEKKEDYFNLSKNQGVNLEEIDIEKWIAGAALFGEKHLTHLRK